MTTRAILTYENTDGHRHILFFRTAEEAKNKVKYLRSLKMGFCNFKIKIVKPLDNSKKVCYNKDTKTKGKNKNEN